MGPMVLGSCPWSIWQIPAPIPEAVVGAVRGPPLRKPPEKLGIFLQNISGTQHEIPPAKLDQQSDNGGGRVAAHPAVPRVPAFPPQPFSARLLDHQNGTGGLADNPFGNAPHEEFLQSGATITADDDQIHLIFNSLLDNAGIG